MIEMEFIDEAIDVEEDVYVDEEGVYVDEEDPYFSQHHETCFSYGEMQLEKFDYINAVAGKGFFVAFNGSEFFDYQKCMTAEIDFPILTSEHGVALLLCESYTYLEQGTWI